MKDKGKSIIKGKIHPSHPVINKEVSRGWSTGRSLDHSISLEGGVKE